MFGEFLGKSERAYTNRAGEARIARNVSLLLDSGEVGQLFVPEDAYKSAAQLKRGDRVRVVVGASVFNGSVQLRPERFEVVTK